MELPALAGLRDPDPTPFVADIGVSAVMPGGTPWIDPNVGFQAQALGKLSADQWLAGQVPWWNSFNGAGLPLAAEAQPGALFVPFVLLYHFRAGWLWVKLLMQMTTGAFCFALLRRLGLAERASVTGALLFEFNGTFGWHGPPITTPIAFLPMLLLGVEQLRGRIADQRPGGWVLIPLAVAWSIYAGFPETAYIDGLFAGGWVMARLGGLDRRQIARFVAKLFGSVTIGLACALPLVIPFAELLTHAYTGGHGSSFAHAGLSLASVAVSLMPWLFGPIFRYDDPAHIIADVWGGIGGYLPVLQVAVLLLGLQLAPRRLGLMLGLWLLLCLAKCFDLRPVSDLINLIPLIKSAAFSRYSPPSWEFAGAVLVAMAIDGLARAPVARNWRMVASFGASLAAACLALWLARTPLASLWGIAGYHVYFLVAVGWMAASLALGLLLLLLGRQGLRALSALLVLDACIAFAMPVMSGAAHVGADGGGISFLRAHAGLQRVYSLRPIAPNYGAFFKIAQINHNYLPVPDDWLTYIHRNLDPGADGVTFIGDFSRTNPATTAAEELRDRLAAYEALGVRYIVAPPGETPLSPTISLPVALGGDHQPKQLANDESVVVHWQVPNQALPRSLAELSILIGNNGNHANGALVARICSAPTLCATGQAALASSLDNAPISVRLDHPLPLGTGPVGTSTLLDITITHVHATYPVALWLVALTPAGQRQVSFGATPSSFAPVLGLTLASAAGPDVAGPPVYSGSDMAIYELPGARPYFEAGPGQCALNALSRTELIADCTVPTTLLRREAFYPGWAASIDGKNAVAVTADGLFQKIEPPAGRHRIAFTYRPSHFGLILSGLILGVLAILAGVWREFQLRQPRI